ncbi:MBL fold metallo-hydrolase [Alicyclobacillus pomorum]|uniref:MBL fold metallo-hydrolase n=1 Tax=Alicyclobacillus pomorum TaxID=204470 RepID=UPI000417B0B9|nr:MBL fold metallo-hydrolase [Alicyclobacillus pomorum]
MSTLEITKNVHLLESAKGSFVYLVLGEEPVLIDTGMPGRGERLLADLSKVGISPKDIAHILLTHHDVDHIGNAKMLKEVTGATLWAPEKDVPYIHGEQRREGIKRIIATMFRPDPPAVDAIYKPGQKIGSLEMIETPGHTPGHVSFLYKDVLFPGDLVMSRKGKILPSPRFLAWDNHQLHQSIEKVKRMTFDWVCPAHGHPVRRTPLF